MKLTALILLGATIATPALAFQPFEKLNDLSFHKKADFDLEEQVSNLNNYVTEKVSSSKVQKPKNVVTGQGEVYSVIDGDTIWVNTSKSTFYELLANPNIDSGSLNKKYNSVKMRIGGINTPESVHRDKSRNTTIGKKASRYLKSWAEKGKANFTCYDTGKFGRPICQVSVNGRDIGYEMIKSGYSDYITSWGRHPYLDKEYRAASR